eukprot:9136760-Pyramimonas_sp.AAC.1
MHKCNTLQTATLAATWAARASDHKHFLSRSSASGCDDVIDGGLPGSVLSAARRGMSTGPTLMPRWAASKALASGFS